MSDYVLDCTFGIESGLLLAFCPAEYADDGTVQSVTIGITYLSTSPPDGSRFVGVFHSDGQEACDAWCADNQDIIDRLVAERELGRARGRVLGESA
jgi:ethanolamine utilization microcompartment shell protein EutL